MSNKRTDFIKTIGGGASTMVKNVLPRIMAVLILCSVLLTTSAFEQSVTPFKASSLVKLGDEVKYGFLPHS